MSRDWRLRVEDILAAAERATRFVGEMDRRMLLPPWSPGCGDTIRDPDP